MEKLEDPMARPIRLKLEKDNATYHVMARTAQQTFLFEDPSIREWVYKQITWLGSIYYVDLHSISVMSNHYHIILSVRKPPKSEPELKSRFEAHQKIRKNPKIWRDWRIDSWYNKLTDLSQFMKEFNESTAKYLNFKNKTHGHVWGDRFKSVLIEDGAGLLTCMAYVELNCVRAGLVDKPTDYRFCSVGRYVQGGEKSAGVKFPALGMFEGLKSKKQHQKAFSLYVDHLAKKQKDQDSIFTCEITKLQELIESQSAPDILDLVFKRTKWMINSVILGSEPFCKTLISQMKLQMGSCQSPRPFKVSNQFYNSHQREGPFLT